MFHGIQFGEDGEPLIPPGVDEELWRLELLGVGYGRGPGESDEEAVAEECAEEVSPTDSVAHGTCAHQDPMLLHAQCLECPGCCAYICAGPCTFPYGGYASPSGRAFLDANATERPFGHV